jgi:hypothetical protein
MSAPVAPTVVARWIPDHLAVVGMLMATALAIVLVMILFSVLRRFSRQERREAPAYTLTPISLPVSTPRLIAGRGRG